MRRPDSHSVTFVTSPRTEGVMTIDHHAHLLLALLAAMDTDHGIEHLKGLIVEDAPGPHALRDPHMLGIAGIGAQAHGLGVSTKEKQTSRSREDLHGMCQKSRSSF